ncbi:mitochondrial import inner membrane translocase subunit tim44 [Saitoella complicata NRRL Y-17804]|uniref:Mitochondrial import inner membrane translocase subunit TIM44 n=1 Tax=Saitoella complicata (strain BCRC 22490 / CBS 7301 / JCM 7358 / NBRC 10748 / NRRL Y-17804) TaxID=698492 RepID=A0A0E9NGW1_SAICN|nr:mitochondrial import inner membrane translocase subunit tim44 [Saitoella complicata NRRL Y-17804]ODQ52985.1 mitochondrial import inner membrane translocase subunit tim44 [Saitoella complicata NRRL Y-17804]GAO49048.1 hypothetical protein G7K_3209-t1 [Saitoella complicata NRRL Y-17804]
MRRAVSSLPLRRQIIASRTFHASSTLREGNPRSPLKVFMETFKSELQKSNELQEKVKALSDETGKVADSESFSRAKDAFTKAKERADAVSAFGGKHVQKAAEVVGTGAKAAWEAPLVKGTRKVVTTSASAVASGLDTATKPIRESEAYKKVSSSVAETIDDGRSSAYGGYIEKEERRKRREAREAGKHYVTPNADAGEALVLHKDSQLKEAWKKWKEDSAAAQALNRVRHAVNESENPMVERFRDMAERVSDTWSGWFAETESAQVVRMFKEIDPTFSMEPFLQELREFILPEVVEAYVKGDGQVLKQWLGEAPFSVWSSINKQYVEQGVISDGKVLDIRGVDIAQSKILPPNDIPVFVVSFRCQEVHLYRNMKTGELVAGSEDAIQLVPYVAVITRIPDEVTNPETRGWRIADFARGAARDYT